MIYQNKENIKVSEYCEIFRRCLPFAVRSAAETEKIFGDPELFAFEERDSDGHLIGLTAGTDDTVYLLCVDERYRRQGK